MRILNSFITPKIRNMNTNNRTDVLQTIFIMVAIGAALFAIYESHTTAKLAKLQIKEHEEKTAKTG